jgi:hypothetical protein
LALIRTGRIVEPRLERKLALPPQIADKVVDEARWPKKGEGENGE